MDSSDDSIEERTRTTKVLLGYASEEACDDSVSSLGGSPCWLGGIAPPPELLQCLLCRRTMIQLVQLDGELPEHFPGHARRLHVLTCRAMTCSRREGSIRAIRSTRILSNKKVASVGKGSISEATYPSIGDQLFSHANASDQPTSQEPLDKVKSSQQLHPTVIAQPTLEKQVPQIYSLNATDRSLSGAHGSLSSRQNLSLEADEQHAKETCGSESSDFPFYYLDAEYETLEATTITSASTASSMFDTQIEGAEETSQMESSTNVKTTFDSAFQRFADRLAQNPLQVIRYEYKGFPLLYSKEDDIGKLVSAARAGSINSGRGIYLPRCQNCERLRVFEMQVTPHTITQLERGGEATGGMDWGTLILGVCEGNCERLDVKAGEVSHLEEWIGVQWE